MTPPPPTVNEGFPKASSSLPLFSEYVPICPVKSMYCEEIQTVRLTEGRTLLSLTIVEEAAVRVVRA